ncbi:NIMA (never in mitosis gene a)-related kinase [Mytilus galloprovincialis]|uniref:NIMA (Never in mitosis gene a)-related kinase n=1 Tax=Mytilus galloprovincialis TaxID=29158 RepID=A0A8B6HU03_MYTGA|nr:NIMA (never in mitosis gene a)-related kinase [Mytilus galloprovincialis]
MELIDGVPLEEHLNNLKDKNEQFAEDRIWKILMQMVLALRYLHKEKGILHRDLAPKNIMLGENDKVTITDFGLAKQKRSDCSKMTSVVGTIVYWCPEIVQNQPYGEKADVWALGCILYQMCMLKPPFYSDNMLSLVTKVSLHVFMVTKMFLVFHMLWPVTITCHLVNVYVKPKEEGFEIYS